MAPNVPIPFVVLNNGRSMPLLGMGTATYPSVPSPNVVEAAVADAIDLGYRHFDTASIYGTEAPLGRAIARAIGAGTLRGRGDVFVTSKLAPMDAHRDLVLPALRRTLQELGMEYVDLYLVHFPGRICGDKRMVFGEESVMEFDLKGVWEGMEECYRLGLAKSIGVSNFTCRKLDFLLSNATIPPAVNQVEMHPVWQQAKLREFCKVSGIHVSAYSPFGGGPCNGMQYVLHSDMIKQLAEARGKSPAQIVQLQEVSVEALVHSNPCFPLRRKNKLQSFCNITNSSSTSFLKHNVNLSTMVFESRSGVLTKIT